MPKKTDFIKRADEFLAGRLEPVQRLGELLDTKTEQEAALSNTNAAIEKAVRQCVEAGWKPAELATLGVPKAALPKRQQRATTPKTRTPQPAATHHTPPATNSAAPNT